MDDLDPTEQYVPTKGRRGPKVKTYEDYVWEYEEMRNKKQAHCGHKRLAVLCLDCAMHLEKTKKHDAMVEVIFI